MRRATRVVLDAMGGDYAPRVNIDGALSALKACEDLNITLIGPREKLLRELQQRDVSESDRLSISHAESVVSMEDSAVSGVRRRRDSSIHVGLERIRDGHGDVFISAGHSGAVMAAALFILGRLESVERPAIVVRLPTAEGAVTVLDCGANVDCKPNHLVQFAQMGSVFAEVICQQQRPRIALLSNGSEAHKGNELTRETHTILTSRSDLNYIGYVEGYDIFRGSADVIVCDGFVGNVTLKLAEGLAETAFRWFRNEVRKSPLSMLGVLLLKRVLTGFRKKFDYQPYGAAPLLGIDGQVLISHGSSSAEAIRNGILTAKRGVDEDFLTKIKERLHIGAKSGSTAP